MTKFKASMLALAVCMVLAGTALAQDPRPTPTSVPNATNTNNDNAPGNGSIRGTVYEDGNFDGKCGPGDKVVAGIPIRFSSGGSDAIYLQTGDNGTFGLVAVSYGTWQVSAEPPSGWAVSSARSIEVTLANEDGRKLNTGVDFCLIPAGSGGGTATLLPEAGAPVAPSVAALLLTGMLLIGVGLTLDRRRRQVVSGE